MKILKINRCYLFLFVALMLLGFHLNVNAVTFDSDKPVLSYDTEYNQSFTTTWDNTAFYNQWETLGANCFSATDIANGYLQFVWPGKHIMCSKKAYGSPYVFQTTLDYAGFKDGGMVLRYNEAVSNKLQEPGKTSTYNRIGIAIYPADANNYRIQFNGTDVSMSNTLQTIISLSKPGDITSLITGQLTVRVEDFGEKIYVYMNGSAFAKIVLGGLSGTTYTSGTVYNAALTQVGTFSSMVVPAIGKVAVAQRGAPFRLYNAMVKTNKAIGYDKVATTYNVPYNMNGSATFNQTAFNSNWDALSNFSSTNNVTSSYWMLGWTDPRIIRTKNTFNYPYKYEVDYALVSSATTGGVIIRAPSAGNIEDLQEPAVTGIAQIYNRSGIAFFSTTDGTGMYVQFSGVVNGYSTPYKRILIPTVNAINFRNRGTIRIEDFGTNIYVYFNESALCRISFVSTNSGIVFDSNMSVLGTFENMVIPATDFKLAIANRQGTATDVTRIYSIKISNTNTPVALTITNPSASNKQYDGNTTAVITGTLNGILNSDDVSLIGTGTFASAGVGTGIAVTSTSTLSGTNAGKYTLTQPTGLTANITPASTPISGGNLSNTGLTDIALANTSITVSSGEFIVNDTKTVQSLTVAPGAKLTFSSGALTATNGITLQSDVNGTATLIDSYSAPTITATVKQYLSSARNWYFTPAVTGVTVPASSTYFGYDEAGLNTDILPAGSSEFWKPYATGASLTAGKGYIIQSGSANTLSFTNTTISGDVSPVLTYNSGKGNGYNLVGNPYPSYLSWSAVYDYDFANGKTANMPTGTIWYRTINYNDKNAWAPNTAYNVNDIVYNGTRFYQVTSAGTSAASGGPSTTDAVIIDNGITWAYQGSVYVFATVSATGVAVPTTVNNLIPPMQAFWVKTAAGGGTLRFKNSMRSHNTTGATNALKAPKNSTSEMPFIRLSVTNGASVDEAVIYSSTNASNAFDSYDAPKYFNTAGSNQAEIYSQIGTEKLVVNAMNEITPGTEMALGFVTEKANNFKISATEMKNITPDMQVILKDNQLNKEFELSAGIGYEFSSTAVNSTDRFNLIFKLKGTTTDIENASKFKVQVFVNATNQITIIATEKASYSIYNAVGQLIENGQTITKQKTLNSKLNSGLYVVKVNGESTRVIVK